MNEYVSKCNQSNEVLLNNRECREEVLIVEDEFCCAMVLQLMLESCGCKVLVANNCEEGLSILRTHQHCLGLIMLDIMMPGKTGIDFLIEAKSEDMLRDTPVIIQSGESIEVIQKAIDAGACGYIHKPYIKEEILNFAAHLVNHELPKYFERFGFIRCA